MSTCSRDIRDQILQLYKTAGSGINKQNFFKKTSAVKTVHMELPFGVLGSLKMVIIVLQQPMFRRHVQKYYFCC